MLNKLATIGSSVWYWLMLVALGLSMEAVALYYQYALNYGPCVLCIHVRIWILGLILVALLAIFIRNVWFLSFFAHLLIALIATALLEVAWRLLGTERGTILGDCSMESGLPGWFALDQWFPKLFGIWEACGYTPKILFGVSMAEGLIVFAAALLLASMTLAAATFFARKVTGRNLAS